MAVGAVGVYSVHVVNLVMVEFKTELEHVLLQNLYLEENNVQL